MKKRADSTAEVMHKRAIGD